VLRDDLRVAFQLLHDGVSKDRVADHRLHRFTFQREVDDRLGKAGVASSYLMERAP
jgi:hypothetical protein